MQVKYSELIKKIKMFNEIVLMDLDCTDKRKWIDFLDPIAKYLYNRSYLEFVKENELKEISMPGALEKYFNIFSYVLKDLKIITPIETASDIYESVTEIKKYFDRYINLNNFKVLRVTEDDFGIEKVRYSINPLI
ncbi:MAG: hypothetical protein ACRC4M_01025 [Mycoplasma sp.]